MQYGHCRGDPMGLFVLTLTDVVRVVRSVSIDAGGFLQRDTDADGYGNFCDPELDNNVAIN